MDPQQIEREVKNSLPEIIVEGNAQSLVRHAEMLGEALGDRRSKLQLNTSQVRAIFGSVRRIDMSWDVNAEASEIETRLVLLKPKMKYRAAREGYKGRGLELLANVLSEGIDLVVEGGNGDSRKRFTNFVNFFEAVLAYHRVAGGN